MKNLLITALILISTSAFASNESIDLLNDARAVAKLEINAANSGRYGQYTAETLRSILLDIRQSIESARNKTDSAVTIDLTNEVISQIDNELKYSHEFATYRLKTVSNMMRDISNLLGIAIKYDNQRNLRY